MTRPLLWIGGWISLILGFIGVFLPVLPTVPFILLAAICFSRASPRMHSWLRNHRIFGPGLRDWEDRGVIRRYAKVRATLVLVLSFTALWIFGPISTALKTGLTAISAGVLVYIWTRPES